MVANIINGRQLAAEIRQEIAEGAAAFARQCGRKAGLGVILVGDDPGSRVYVRNKERAAVDAGFESFTQRLLAAADLDSILGAVRLFNRNRKIDGYLVQMPLPDHRHEQIVLDTVDAEKDADGFHTVNLGRLVSGQGIVAPATPSGIMDIFSRSNLPLAGQEVVIVGRSLIVGKPLAFLFLQQNATVTICHSHTRDLATVCRRADILVAAVGSPWLLDRRHIKPGSVVIDVGINRIAADHPRIDHFLEDPVVQRQIAKRQSALVGDICAPDARESASYMTPVPGGVGPLTIAALLRNTLTLARVQAGMHVTAH